MSVDRAFITTDILRKHMSKKSNALEDIAWHIHALEWAVREIDRLDAIIEDYEQAAMDRSFNERD
jgi:hypothetical protein